MLKALQANYQVTAWDAQKGPIFVCPNCRARVALKKGRLIAHHFAHMPPTICSWAAGETEKHLNAKMLLHATLAARGLSCAVEHEVLSIEGIDERMSSPGGLRGGSRSKCSISR